LEDEIKKLNDQIERTKALQQQIFENNFTLYSKAYEQKERVNEFIATGLTKISSTSLKEAVNIYKNHPQIIETYQELISQRDATQREDGRLQVTVRSMKVILDKLNNVNAAANPWLKRAYEIRENLGENITLLEDTHQETTYLRQELKRHDDHVTFLQDRLEH